MAKAKEKAKEEDTEEAAGGKKKKGRLLVIILLAVVLAGGGGFAAWYFLVGNKGAPGAVEPKPAPKPVFEQLEPFTVNLAGDDDRYLQVGLSLKLADSDVKDRIKEHIPEIRDAMLRLLSAKKAEDLYTVAGKNQLSDEIRVKINSLIGVKAPEKGVLGVLFLSFIIQ